MKYYTLNTNEQELAHLHRVYGEHLLSIKNKDVNFVAKHNNVMITSYKNGKLVLAGKEIHEELLAITKMLNREDYAAVGSDEVGTTDVFGPVVVCAAYTTVEDVEFLNSLNIRKKKVLDDDFIIKVAPKIAKRLTHSMIILSPEKYNRLVDEDGYNMNRIKAHLHNQAIISLTSKLKDKEMPVILDRFCRPKLYYNYLKGETLIYRDIQFEQKAANTHISVAAAKIIARYGYLYNLQKCSKVAEQKLLRGATKKVDEQLADIVNDQGVSILDQIAKTNFKNVTKQDF